MANKPIKVIVLEGDSASLTALGFPMAVSLQLQQSCLSLSEAMWTAKSTNGGFSVSLFWPAPAPELKSDVQVKRKRKRRRRAKASKLIVTSAKSYDPELPKPSNKAARKVDIPHTPINAHASSSPPMANNYCENLSTHRDDNGRLNQSGIDDENESEQQWTKVVSKRRRKTRLPPCWKLRFPAHLRADLHTPSESTSTSEESDEDPGMTESEGRPELTPVAARTRSKLKS